MSNQKITSILNPMCRGLVGYISYLATTSASEVYSEYLLYEPLLRIALAKKYNVKCEFPVEKTGKKGDDKKVDFLLKKNDEELAIEVKWARANTINILNDIEKIDMLNCDGVILVFGQTKFMKDLKFSKCVIGIYKTHSKGKLITWVSGKTSYSAQWFRFMERKG